MQDKIYVVIGSNGDHDDCSEWNVVFYLDRLHAEAHAKIAEKESERLINDPQYQVWYEDFTGEMDSYTRVPKGANKFDPNCYFYYSDSPEYRVEEILKGNINEK